MAIRYAIKTGNWSDPTVWNGGLGLPTASDDVYTNTYIVTIDQNITVLSLQNGATTGVAANGYFLATNGVTINANILTGSTVNNTLGPSANGVTFTVNGNISTTTSQSGIYWTYTDITLNVNGTITGCVNSTGHGINASGSNATLNITGNIYGGNIGNTVTNGANGINITKSCNLTVIGNVYAGESNGIQTNTGNSNGIISQAHSENVNITITGNLYGASPTVGTQGAAICIYAAPNTHLTVNGNVYSGQGGNKASYGIYVRGATSNNIIVINGNLYGSSALNDGAAFYVISQVQSITITGDIIANLGPSCSLSYSSTVAITSDTISASTSQATALVLSGVTNATISARYAATAGGRLFSISNTNADITITEPVLCSGTAFPVGSVLYVNASSTGLRTINFIGTIDGRPSNGTTGATTNGLILFGLGNASYSLLFNMTGDIYAGAINGLYISQSAGLYTINITGNVYGGDVGTDTNYRYGIYNVNQTGQTIYVNVYGRLCGGKSQNSYGIFLNNPTPTVFADTLVSNDYPIDTYANHGALVPVGGTLTACSLEYGAGGLTPYSKTNIFFQESASNYVKARASQSGPIVLMGDVAADYPAVTNVRNAITYNFGSQVGTLKVPNPASVAVGVPVDNTVGTAVLTAEALWGLPTDQMSTPGSIGERLKNSATVDTVAAQLVSLL